MYCGRDIIAKNSNVEKYGDERGYVCLMRGDGSFPKARHFAGPGGEMGGVEDGGAKREA